MPLGRACRSCRSSRGRGHGACRGGRSWPVPGEPGVVSQVVSERDHGEDAACEDACTERSHWARSSTRAGRQRSVKPCPERAGQCPMRSQLMHAIVPVALWRRVSLLQWRQRECRFPALAGRATSVLLVDVVGARGGAERRGARAVLRGLGGATDPAPGGARGGGGGAGDARRVRSCARVRLPGRVRSAKRLSRRRRRGRRGFPELCSFPYVASCP